MQAQQVTKTSLGGNLWRFIDDDGEMAVDVIALPESVNSTTAALNWCEAHKAELAPDYQPPVSWTQVRTQRDALLAACDWTQLPDAPLTDAARAAWQSYRQALRDVPETYDDPGAAVWPEAPAIQ